MLVWVMEQDETYVSFDLLAGHHECSHPADRPQLTDTGILDVVKLFAKHNDHPEHFDRGNQSMCE